jgi:hypothetical protein
VVSYQHNQSSAKSSYMQSKIVNTYILIILFTTIFLLLFLLYLTIAWLIDAAKNKVDCDLMVLIVSSQWRFCFYCVKSNITMGM